MSTASLTCEEIPFVEVKCPNCRKVRGEGFAGYARIQCRPCNLKVAVRIDDDGNVEVLSRERLR